ncbi:MAG TPA: class II aldolase/adducin family protein [Armatimonadota bacterium]|nr:class II aldolase/adducin family protein [Armatimonadota bacterium]
MPDEGRLRRDICEIGRRLWMQGLVAATDGNFSCRLGPNELLATPTGVSKGFMSPEEVVKIDMNGAPIEGFTKPSSEIKMHLAIYEDRPDACAIVHGHPPTATGYAAARIPVPTEILTEAATFLGPVAVVEYATPGSHDLPEALRRHVRQHDLFLLANHGAVAVGSDLFAAAHRMEALEQSAKIAIVARQLGGAQEIDPADLSKLQAIRTRMGLEPSDRPCLNAAGSCGANSDPADEALVERITDLVMQALQNSG